MKPRILCVDDDLDVLNSLTDALRPHFDVHIAQGGAEGLIAAKRDGPFTIILSDLGMPVLDGSVFLKRVKAEVPEAVRVVLTGSANLQMAAKVVNEAEIFRLLIKPCKTHDLVTALTEAVCHQAEQALEKTGEAADAGRAAKGTVQMLTGIMAISDPKSYGRALRLKGLVGNLARACGIDPTWPVEAAALLSQMEGIVLPGETIERMRYGQWLAREEENLVQALPSVIDRLLSNVDGLERARSILKALPVSRGKWAPDDVTWESRALRLVLDYDEALSKYQEASAAVAVLAARATDYDPEQFHAFVAILSNRARFSPERRLRLDQLRTGMVLAEDVLTKRGVLLVAQGIGLTPQLLAKLRERETEIRGVGFKVHEELAGVS